MAIDRLDQLRSFMAVANARSFSAAARALQVSTNAVSLRVRQLERSVRARLLVRTTRKVSLTEEGQRLYSRAAELLVGLNDLEAELDPSSRSPRGTVRIGLPAVIAGSPFLRHMRPILDKYPELVVHTRVTNAMVMPASENLDIVVAAGEPPDSSMVARRLGRGSWVLAATPEYVRRHGSPRTPNDLIKHRCLRLLSNPPQDQWTLVAANGKPGAEFAVPVGGNYQADDSRVLGDAVYAGLGIGLRSAPECAAGVRKKTLVRVLPAYRFAPMDIYAYMPKGSGKLPRVATCLDALEETMQELL
jgi:DNA-binding transcriptional LysR family regulator